ncbi:conjugative transfer protein Ti, putative [Babesia ovata]|uniref:Conjugative transfer protein Ti, putative n=1 Tax=Babesia ovata TaxID=189622 RepID=A0A2H6K6B3_9APIC|nr:conjugative transfer protein Ti, putative [Babesia ovata]GBE58529.1 conjugative transfer protein Ti, putative [Babesia ovata]
MLAGCHADTQLADPLIRHAVHPGDHPPIQRVFDHIVQVVHRALRSAFLTQLLGDQHELNDVGLHGARSHNRYGAGGATGQRSSRVYDVHFAQEAQTTQVVRYHEAARCKRKSDVGNAPA